jgi:methionyl-tRNA synthetase
MSKSTGNVVDPFFAIERFGVDVMRFYLAHNGGITDDSDYDNRYIVERYKKSLGGGLGNLVSRITRPKIWKVQDAVENWSKGLIPVIDEPSRRLADKLNTVAERADILMRQLNPGLALHEIMEVVYIVRHSFIIKSLTLFAD